MTAVAVRAFLIALWLALVSQSLGQESGPAPGAEQPKPRARRDGFGPPPFVLKDALDTNKDGKLSAEEIKAAAESLRKLDANQDGKLSAEELGWPPRMAGGPRGGGPFGGPSIFVATSQGLWSAVRRRRWKFEMPDPSPADGRAQKQEWPGVTRPFVSATMRLSMHFRTAVTRYRFLFRSRRRLSNGSECQRRRGDRLPPAEIQSGDKSPQSESACPSVTQTQLRRKRNER